jgi:hypothetical protein
LKWRKKRNGGTTLITANILHTITWDESCVMRCDNN